jgi:transporter family protein
MAALKTVFAKIGLQHVGLLTGTALRSIVMMVFSIVVMLALGDGLRVKHYFEGSRVHSAERCGWRGVMGALLPRAPEGEATPVALIDKSSLLFVIALSVIILHEQLAVKKIVASALMIAAIYLLVFKIKTTISPPASLPHQLLFSRA